MSLRIRVLSNAPSAALGGASTKEPAGLAGLSTRTFSGAGAEESRGFKSHTRLTIPLEPNIIVRRYSPGFPMTKPPPSMIDALERPRCPRCGKRMAFAGIEPEPSDDFETRKFDCLKCGTALDRRVAKDPIQDAAGWLNSSLQPPK